MQTEAAYYANGSASPWLAAPVTLTDWAERLPSQFYSLVYVASSGWSASRYANAQLGTLVNRFEATSSTTQRQSLAN